MLASHATAWANIARVVRSQGLKGEVVVVPTDGLPFLVREGMTVTLTPPPLKGVRSAQVRGVREVGNGWVVLFEGVDTIDIASTLAGRLVLARKTDLPVDFLDTDIVGACSRMVHDRHYGVLGTIQEVLSSSAQDIWVVQGRYGEVLIPVVDAMVCDIPDDESLPIEVDLPEGLVPVTSPLELSSVEGREV
jgi:16S rRNA processing protein RimM